MAKIRHIMALAAILAACDDRDGPVAPESGPGPDVAPAPANAAATAAVRFGTPQRWSSSLCRKGEVCLIADVDGDRKYDVVVFNHGVDTRNAVYVGRSSGTGFGAPEKWSSLFCRSTETCATGDVNGDHKDDIIAFTRGTPKDVWVALSNGTSFGLPQKWHDFFCRAGEVCKVAHVNGDAAADLVAFQHGVNGRTGVFVALSEGKNFGPAQQWRAGFCLSGQTCEIGYSHGWYNPIIAFTRDPDNEVWVGLSKPPVFAPPARFSLFFCRTGEVCLSHDFNGDDRFDVIAFNHGLDGANAVYVATANGESRVPPTGFNPTVKASDYFCTKSQTCAVGDVNADGRADVIAFTRGATPQTWVGISLP